MALSYRRRLSFRSSGLERPTSPPWLYEAINFIWIGGHFVLLMRAIKVATFL